jgi:hypothetical protein
METLTQPRIIGINKILDWDREMGSKSVLSYNDMIFLHIIETIGLTEYSSSIKDQLNIIREIYIRYNQGKTLQWYVRQVDKYDSYNPFRIGVICEHSQDFRTEIVSKIHRSFSYKMHNQNHIIVESMFEFIKISKCDHPRGYMLHGYIETPNAYLNKEYQEIKRVIQPAFVP